VDHCLTLEVGRVLMELYRIDAVRAKDTVCRYFVNMDNIAAAMSGTNSDLRAQFDVLQALLRTHESDPLATRSIQDLFSSKMVLQYFKLNAAYEPESALAFVKRHGEFCPLDEFLLIAQERNIPDATAALLQRNGNVEAAMSVLLKNFSLLIKQAKREIDAQLRFDLNNEAHLKSPRSSMSLISQILSKQGAARFELMSRLPVYKSIVHLVHCAADLCWEQSQQQAETNSALWFQIFDHLLHERREYPF
jgi:hypothetical protein